MSDFERHQAMMLDSAYGLLAPEQAAELEHFLSTSPEGETLRHQAEEWKRQLAVAAKSEFPDVRFTPPSPSAKSAAKPMPSKPAAHAKKRPTNVPMNRAWVSWAIAASVLAVVLGFGIPVVRHSVGQMEQARNVRAQQAEYDKTEKEHNTEVAAYNTRRDLAARELKAATEEHEEIEKNFATAIADARKAIEDKQFIVRLSGPERAQPGAPNQWTVDMYKLNGHQHLPSRIEWVIKDQTGQALFADSKEAGGRGSFREMPTVNLPISVWEKVKPGSELTMEVIAYDDNLKTSVNAKVKLARPVFITHLTTDKPLYKQGETVYFRSLTLDRGTFTPPERDQQLQFRITKPDSSVVAIDSGVAKVYADAQQPARTILGADKKPLRGIGCGEFPIEPGAPGGEYKLSVVDITPSYDEVRRQVIHKDVVLESRKFNVIEYKPETFDKTLEFDGKSYGAGDIVMVKCTASRTQGGKLKKAAVKAEAVVDGQRIEIPNTTTDDEGVVRLKFTLPKIITKGEGSLSVTFIQGESEPIIRPIPLVGRIIEVEFFPEGGDLIENVPSRVYFQAKTHTGKPADIKGTITDGTETIAEVATLTDADQPGVNRGQGVFTITPKPGKTYFLKVQKPSGIIEPTIKKSVSPATVARAIGLANLIGGGSVASAIATGFELPKVKDDGVILTALDAVTNPDQPIRVRLQTTKSKKVLVVGAYARGRLIDHQRIEAMPGAAVELKLNPIPTVGGVTRLTVFEEKPAAENQIALLVPVAERLVFRKSAQSLMINVQPDRNRYNPGSMVGLDVFAMTENEKPVPAILMVAVVNQSVLTMADEKTGRLMPTHFLLASEVNKPEDLEHADFLLVEKEKAAIALDLLLGTQGWRRFAEQHPGSNQKLSAELDRFLVHNGQKSQAPVETFRQEEQKVLSDYMPKIETADNRLTQANETNSTVQGEFAQVRENTQRLDASRSAAYGRLQDSLAKLRQYEDNGAQSRAMLFARLCIGLLLITGVCVYIGAMRRGNAGISYFATATGCFALCAATLFTAAFTSRESGVATDVGFNSKKLTTPDHFNNFEGVLDPKDVHNLIGTRADKLQEKLAERQKADQAGLGGGGGGGAPQLDKRMMARPLAPMMPRPMMMGVQGNLNKNKMLDRAEKFDKDAAKGEARFLREMKAEKEFAADEGKAFNRQRQAAQDNFFRKKQVREEQLRRMADGKFGFNGQPAAGAKVARGFGGFGAAAAPVGPGGPAALEAGFDIDMQLMQMEETPGFFVREFKFKKAAAESGKPEQRDDFTETVYWHPVLVLPETGRADLHFQLSDSIARYQVLVAGHTLDGRIGATITHIEARKPFTVDPKTPIEVTAGDRIDVPVRIVNDSDVRRAVTFQVTPNGLRPADPKAVKIVDGKIQDWLELTPNQKDRKIVSFVPTIKEGEVSLQVVGNSDPMDTPDQILRCFRVVPEGFPTAGAFSDLLEKRANAHVELPAIIKGTLKVQVNVYPTTLADLQQGLESLMREPNGCFEQTSTSNYPNLLILDYLKSSDQVKPELAQRAKDLIDRGYAKLISFECPRTGENKQGFDWFGQADQQHQALTAYGLLQFKDLSKVYKVDPELIKRTQQYLLGQQNPNGEGFKRNLRAIDSFGGAPDYLTNVYIVWALVESDPDDKEGLDLAKQFAFLKKQAKENAECKDDPYFLALLANALLHRPSGGNREEAIAILERIVEKNLKNGSIEGAKTSITRSGGRDLQVEATALTVLALLRSGEPTKFIKSVKEMTKWIGQQRGGHGGFGSTQSTILALKSLIEYTKASRKPAEAGEVRITVNGKTFNKTFTEKDQEVITLDIDKPEDFFKPGPNEALVEITTKQAYPFSLTWSCSTEEPASAAKCAVEIANNLDKNAVIEGDTVRLNVSVKNKLDEGHGMAVAIVGLPGGCRLPADLKELTKLREDGKISYFEVRGRELIIYWKSLQPKELKEISVGLICEVPGEYKGPASRGYLYYNADHKHWVKPLAIAIAPSNQPGNEDVAGK